MQAGIKATASTILNLHALERFSLAAALDQRMSNAVWLRPPPAGPGTGGSAPSAPVVVVVDDVFVDFYIKVFIPLNVDGVTEAYPKDRASKTMIPGIPVVGDCFLTDQRSFSSDSGASARMFSQALVHVSSAGSSASSWSQQHHCGETVEVDCEDGEVEDRKTQNNDHMDFDERERSSSRIVLGFKAGRNNPLVTFSPDIDLEGTLTVDRVNRFVEFVGKVDDFPAFEAYVKINGGAPRIIRQLGPKKDSGPTSLFGGANRDFGGRVSF